MVLKTAFSFTKSEALAQVFFQWILQKNFPNTFFAEHLQATASKNMIRNTKNK